MANLEVSGGRVAFRMALAAALFLCAGAANAADAAPTRFVIALPGTPLRAQPNTASPGSSKAPFGAKVTPVSHEEAAAAQASDWCEVKYGVSRGWVILSDVGDQAQLVKAIKRVAKKDSSFVSSAIKNAFEAAAPTVEFVYSYWGGEMEPASMVFLQDGLMVMSSQLFGPKFTLNYFLYELSENKTRLKITFVDKRIDFAEQVKVETSNQSIVMVDTLEKSITYRIGVNTLAMNPADRSEDSGVYFSNWLFSK